MIDPQSRTPKSARTGVSTLGRMSISDVIYALPPAIFLLVLLASTGPSLPTVIIGIVILHSPRIFRIVRLITMDISKNEYDPLR